MAVAGTWRTIAREVIKGVTERAREEGVTDEKEVIRQIDAAYPFGEREYYPYKAWLQERRIVIALLRGEAPISHEGRKRALSPPYKPAPELEAWLRRQGGLV